MAVRTSRKRATWNLMKFGMVGGSGVIVNTGVLYLLTAYAGMYYVFASILAVETAIVSNFFGNHFFTFGRKRNSKTSLFSKFLRFQSISLVTLVATVCILWILTTLGGIEYLLFWNLVAVGITFILNFALNSHITWKNG